MFRTLRAIRFLSLGPILLAALVVLNLVTSPGHWWVQWPALGIGIAWLISWYRVVVAIVLAGGLAAFISYRRQRG